MKKIEFALELDERINEITLMLESLDEDDAQEGEAKLLRIIRNDLADLGDKLVLTDELPVDRKTLKSAHLVSQYWPLDSDFANRINRLDYLYRNELSD